MKRKFKNQGIAILIKLKSDDRLFEMKDNIEIGKEYVVNLDSIIEAEGYNNEYKLSWTKEIIWDDHGEWLPTELLSIVKV